MSAFGFIGKFSAPGAGDVGVLGLELEHDFETGMKQGVVCLDRRPYWEGSATIFTLEMPATHERAAMTLTGVWTMREIRDGVGCYITVEGVRLQASTPALDETTDPADLDWGAIRSACDRRDWREAWGVVGTDHAGDATPGEVYLLSVARHKSATAAALWQWRNVAMRASVAGVANRVAWQRIKRIAAWESSARAQYDERGNGRGRLQAAVRERLTNAATQARLYGRGDMANALAYGYSVNTTVNGVELNDARGNSVTVTPRQGEASDALREQLTHLAVIARQQETRPDRLYMDGETYDALLDNDPMLHGDGRGVVGVLNNPYLSAAAQRGEITGTLTLTPGAVRALRDLTARVDAGARALVAAAATALETSRQIDAVGRAVNPAPRGPQTGRRRR